MSLKRCLNRDTEARLAVTAKCISEMRGHWQVATEPIVARLEEILADLSGIKIYHGSAEPLAQHFKILNQQAHLLKVRFRVQKSNERGMLYFARENGRQRDALRLRQFKNGKSTVSRRFYEIPKLLVEPVEM